MICFQEALPRQVSDLSSLLGDEYSWIGVGREDGKAAGEFEAVFWRNDVLEVVSWDTVHVTLRSRVSDDSDCYERYGSRKRRSYRVNSPVQGVRERPHMLG